MKMLYGNICYHLFMVMPDKVCAWAFRRVYPVWLHLVVWAGYWVSGRNQ